MTLELEDSIGTTPGTAGSEKVNSYQPHKALRQAAANPTAAPRSSFAAEEGVGYNTRFA